MSSPRIGQMLKRVAGLSDLDIEEILHEQLTGRQRFGEIALTMNLCSQRDVWRAWFMQLGAFTPRIDLRDFGVDSQALCHVPRDLALQYQLLPLRVQEDNLVAAIGDDAALPPAEELSHRLRKDVRFVRAGGAQIETALAQHYGLVRTSA